MARRVNAEAHPNSRTTAHRVQKLALKGQFCRKTGKSDSYPPPRQVKKSAYTPFYEVDILMKRCRPPFSNGLDDRALACAPIYMALQASKDRK